MRQTWASMRDRMGADRPISSDSMVLPNPLNLNLILSFMNVCVFLKTCALLRFVWSEICEVC
jgi:hypothetical protein